MPCERWSQLSVINVCDLFGQRKSASLNGSLQAPVNGCCSLPNLDDGFRSRHTKSSLSSKYVEYHNSLKTKPMNSDRTSHLESSVPKCSLQYPGWRLIQYSAAPILSLQYKAVQSGYLACCYSAVKGKIHMVIASQSSCSSVVFLDLTLRCRTNRSEDNIF